MLVGFFVAILAAFGVILPLSALALPEKELASSFESQVRPFFEGQFSFGSFQGIGGLTLRYAKREAPAKPQRRFSSIPPGERGLNEMSNQRGILVLVKGRTEFLTKYAELLYDLRDLPLSVYILDLRGQGLSDRLLPEQDKGYVANFQDYADDLSIFIDTVVKPEPRQPLLMLTHSMGGTVATLYANSHSGRVSGMILCAPMLGINTKPFPVSVARLLAQGASILGFGTAYVPGGGPYDSAKPFASNDVTHSQARFTLNQKLVAETPANALGSPTYGWVHQAFAGMDRISSDHRNLTMPVLLLQAGADTVVDNKVESGFCSDLPACTLVEMVGARHEILMEEDIIRNRAIDLIREFLERQISPAKERQP